jgi:hypothetical protein
MLTEIEQPNGRSMCGLRLLASIRADSAARALPIWVLSNRAAGPLSSSLMTTDGLRRAQ